MKAREGRGGVPCVNDKREDRWLNIRVSEDLKARFEEIADQADVSVSDLGRSACEGFLEKGEADGVLEVKMGTALLTIRLREKRQVAKVA
jgi:hypothetical protein